MKRIILLAILIIAANVRGQLLNNPIRKGNELYKENKFDEAEVQYRRAESERNQALKQFNLGDALYKQERYEEASEQFSDLINADVAEDLKARAYHNLGNSRIKEQKLKEGIDAYKNALRINPQDQETRANLARALMQLRQQEQQQQQNQDEDQDENQQQDQQQNQDQQDNLQKNQENQKPNPNEPRNQQGDQPQKPQEGQISREDAERLLEALSKAEEKVQQKVNEEKVKGKKTKSEKDW